MIATGLMAASSADAQKAGTKTPVDKKQNATKAMKVKAPVANEEKVVTPARKATKMKSKPEGTKAK